VFVLVVVVVVNLRSGSRCKLIKVLIAIYALANTSQQSAHSTTPGNLGMLGGN
jgi:hypothetical protein